MIKTTEHVNDGFYPALSEVFESFSVGLSPSVYAAYNHLKTRNWRTWRRGSRVGCRALKKEKHGGEKHSSPRDRSGNLVLCEFRRGKSFVSGDEFVKNGLSGSISS